MIKSYSFIYPARKGIDGLPFMAAIINPLCKEIGKTCLK
jgi:hypothetical protein